MVIELFCCVPRSVACLFLQLLRTFRLVCRQLPCSSWIDRALSVIDCDDRYYNFMDLQWLHQRLPAAQDKL